VLLRNDRRKRLRRAYDQTGSQASLGAFDHK
jgi:hypothetical protein